MYSVLNKMIFLIIISVLLFATSCNQAVKPDGILQKDKLSEILVDVHMAEASLQLFNSNERDSIARGYYGHIFRIHEIEEAEFYTSMEYYSAHSKDMADVYEQAGVILNNQITGSDAEVKKKKKVK